jgi:putative flippase GtrA
MIMPRLPRQRPDVQAFRMHPNWSVLHILRFGAVGLFATGVHYTMALIGLGWFGLTPVIANATGFISALAFSFFGHSKITFRTQATRMAALRFVVVNLTTIGLGSVLVAELHRQSSLRDAAVLAIGAIFSAGSNFVGHSLWTFHRPRG